LNRVRPYIADTDEIVPNVDLTLRQEHVKKTDPHVSENALRLRGELLFSLHSFALGDCSIQTQFAANDDILAEGNSVLLGETAASELLPLISDAWVGREADLHPITAGRIDERGQAMKRRIRRERLLFQLLKRDRATSSRCGRWRRQRFALHWCDTNELRTHFLL